MGVDSAIYICLCIFIVVLVGVEVEKQNENVETQKSHKAFSSQSRVFSLFSCL